MSNTFFDNAYHNIIFRYNGGNRTVVGSYSAFLDGVAATVTSSPGIGEGYTKNLLFVFATANNSGAPNISARIQAFGFYSRALSDSECASISAYLDGLS
jgi:hypothetical protein